MGILNVTPDSFSDGGRYLAPARALAHAQRMAADGADVIDVGGESTRPGAAPVPEAEELRRVVPVVEALAEAGLPVAISVDTSKPAVMRAAVEAGASLVNDVRALRVPGALETAAALGVPVCLMHMQGEPRTMQANPVYREVVSEVRDFLLERAAAAEAAGLSRGDLLLDPGFGFGKRLEHNLALLKSLDRLVDTGYPVLVGMSRKRMIGEVLDRPVEQRLHGGLALAVIAALKGAAVVRVHDVGPTVEALKMAHAVMTA
ncbi:MAG: dihydropteroate synthase [Gammaproteobacteria bacterium]|nr:MAG: dihydropteroate synthase [Gammaproteobacteria bacterium]